MFIPERFSKAIRTEFVAFYEVAELPGSWPEWMADLEQITAASAARIRRQLGDVPASELAEFLRTGSQDRQGALIRQIESWTRFGWSDEDDDWTALQQILRAIADQLDRLPASNPTPTKAGAPD